MTPFRSVDYHDATKHHFNRFARSAGRLDWATQPDPFRRFQGADLLELPRVAGPRPDVPFHALYEGAAVPALLDRSSVGEFFRCSMGLSAWKAYRETRWALRVNPSSGNLHPTEAYAVWDGAVHHYAPEAHALERRCVLEPAAWRRYTAGAPGFLVGLSSVHWREAWKYGERAFRYCQHDAGHAIGALRYAAALLGWRCALLPAWSDEEISAVLGLDRHGDFDDREREAPACMAIVTAGAVAPWQRATPGILRDAALAAAWQGRANRLSPAHVDWPIIDRVSGATRYPGPDAPVPVGSVVPVDDDRPRRDTEDARDAAPVPGAVGDPVAPATGGAGTPTARAVLLGRRSAVAFDPRASVPLDRFLGILRRVRPERPPWDALGWPPQVHLALFVHRVDGLVPGVYVYPRDPDAVPRLRASMRAEFLWEAVADPAGRMTGLFLLLPTDVTWVARRLSCDQDIAGEGFFSLGMLARFEAPLLERGEWFYRRLFWECGLVGQVLYLEAEAAGARGTGIGCFYDDAVHETLGLTGHEWQSLYHFSMGAPLDDGRLTTEPGYAWELAPGI